METPEAKAILCDEWLKPAFQQLRFMDSELAAPGMCHVDGHFQFSKPTLSHHQGTLLKEPGPIFYLPSLFLSYFVFF